jgi:hypothetical protein
MDDSEVSLLEGNSDVAGQIVNQFHDLGQLQYLFQSIAANGNPWVRCVFLITNNQVPEWLNGSEPRLWIVEQRRHRNNEIAYPNTRFPCVVSQG